MKRGEIWTISGAGGYAGKPRPAVIVQDDTFTDTESITVCLITTDLMDAPLFRLPLEPAPVNGLRAPSCIMVDKTAALSKSKFGRQIGRLAEEDMVRLNRAMMVFLGLASTRTS
jgi:mRNA interferase MazF